MSTAAPALGIAGHAKQAAVSTYEAGKAGATAVKNGAVNLNDSMARGIETHGVWGGIKTFASKNPLWAGAIVGGTVIGSVYATNKVIGNRERAMLEQRAAQQQGLQR